MFYVMSVRHYQAAVILGLGLLQVFWPSFAIYPEFYYGGCITDKSVGVGTHIHLFLSLHLDHLWVSLIVSICCKSEDFFKKGEIYSYQ